MNASFYNGLMGMKTSQTGIDVLGDNVSNVNTTGYKQQNVDFSTLFSSTLNTSLTSSVTSDIGMSAVTTSTTMDLSQGSIQKTDSKFDLALQGDGWMAVNDANGQIRYTRTGSFLKDANGTLVSANGDKLQVVNANNLIFDGNNWKFDTTIPTDNLVTSTPTLSSIDLPDNVIFPAQATKKVEIAGNLPNNDTAPNPKPANLNSDFGVLYDANAQNMNIKDGQDVAFGFGDNISYSDGLVRYDMCVSDDELDGKNVNVDFDVNGENIQLTLPDGSSSKTIVDAIAKKLDDKNILYSKTDKSIEIKDENKLFVKSNGGDVVTSNGALEKLVYNSNDNTNENFTTTQDFVDKLQGMADFTYGSGVSVGIDNDGKFYIQNNNTTDVNAASYETDNSNDLFIQNLGRLGNVIKPNTASSSLSFNQDYQGFTGSIIDPNGNKNDLQFDFYKTKLNGDNTIWNLTISEIDKDGKILSTKNQDLTFNSIGGLVTPSTIEINNNGTTTNVNLGSNFSGITSVSKDNTGFTYSQDGWIEGNLEGYDVNTNGQIIATFSNAKNGVLGQIPIFHFQNEQGLDSLGGNNYSATNNSGDAFVYTDSQNNYMSGAVVSNYSLENSNVDMGQAMTELIIMQKSFDANSKSITTSDQMVQKAIDMKR